MILLIFNNLMTDHAPHPPGQAANCQIYPHVEVSVFRDQKDADVAHARCDEHAIENEACDRKWWSRITPHPTRQRTDLGIERLTKFRLSA